MPYLTTRDAAKIGQSFDGTLCDDGHTSLPVRATRVSDHWILIGQDDWRQVLQCIGCSGETTFGITPSRKHAAAQARLQRIREAVAAGLALQAALARLDADDQGAGAAPQPAAGALD